MYYIYLYLLYTVGTLIKYPNEKSQQKSKVFFTNQNLLTLVKFHFVLIIPAKLPIKWDLSQVNIILVMKNMFDFCWLFFLIILLASLRYKNYKFSTYNFLQCTSIGVVLYKQGVKFQFFEISKPTRQFFLGGIVTNNILSITLLLYTISNTLHYTSPLL